MNCCQIGNYNTADPIVTSQYNKGRKTTDRKIYMGSKKSLCETGMLLLNIKK